jgi:hypothetical protein
MGISQNFNAIFGGQKGDGEANVGLTEEVDAQYALLADAYKSSENDDPQAAVENVGKAPGVHSMFNPFHVFRYSKYGLNTESYKRDLHFDGNMQGKSPTEAAQNELALSGISFKPLATDTIQDRTAKILSAANFSVFNDVQKTIENPTASTIIKWAQAQGANARSGNGSVITPTPYSTSDFLYCKHYGKVPNNRLVTLRRYPIPVSDNLLIIDKKSPLVPIAQAVTWFGKDVGNNLNSIINLAWGLNWDDRTADVQDLTGNEIRVEDIIKAAGLSGNKKGEKVAAVLKQLLAGNDTVDILKLAGYDTKVQEYIKDSYGQNGPYWNRILGPVNVINSTKIRTRGFKPQGDITLTFDY